MLSVQNKEKWNLFSVFRHSVLAREAGDNTSAAEARFERRWLFHGTDEGTVDKIIQQGFNRSFCGKNKTTYGKGVYFASDASYSSKRRYSIPNALGVQHMFLCRVIVGAYCKGVKNALTPAVRHGSLLFDTTVDNMANPSIYVTYNDAQAYPEYLVRFKQ